MRLALPRDIPLHHLCSCAPGRLIDAQVEVAPLKGLADGLAKTVESELFKANEAGQELAHIKADGEASKNNSKDERAL